MFSGIVEAIGVVRHFKKASARTAVLEVEVPVFLRSLKIGASLAVNGACLTVIRKSGSRLFFDVTSETICRTNLSGLGAKAKVNLERPLKLNGRVEGHFLLGHVDGVGKVIEIQKKKNAKSIRISCPKNLKPYLLEKGSVAVDGVSLTLGKIKGNAFWIHYIPHTLGHTIAGAYGPGTRVNLEADILAKLVLTRKKGHYKL